MTTRHLDDTDPETLIISLHALPSSLRIWVFVFLIELLYVLIDTKGEMFWTPFSHLFSVVWNPAGCSNSNKEFITMTHIMATEGHFHN